MSTGSEISWVELLDRDIDDLVALAYAVDGRKRHDLLIAAAERLHSESDMVRRFILLGFVQALLAAMPNGALNSRHAEQIVRALSGPAAGVDSRDRRAALSAVGVLAVRVDQLSDQLESMLVGLFDRALSDTEPGIREFAHEVMSHGGAVERRLREAHIGVIGDSRSSSPDRRN